MTLYKSRKFGHRDKHTQGECHVKMGVMQPQVKELPEARERSGTDPLLTPSEGALTCQQLYLRLLASKTVSSKFIFLSYLDCATSLR